MHISFLCLHLLETQKRRVLFLTFTDWEAFAALLLEAWTSPASGLELDPQLTATLRHLKGHMADARLNAIMLGAVQAALELLDDNRSFRALVCDFQMLCRATAPPPREAMQTTYFII